MNQFEVVILANSVKHRQHCVAGKCVSTGQWVRPVSNEQGSELSNKQTKYQNPYGTFGVKTLQKIHMGFSSHVPLPHQPENYLIDGNLWRQNYSIEAGELPTYLDFPEDLWGDGNRVDNNTIVSGACNISQSLYLVQVGDLNLYTTGEGKRRASFLYNGHSYDLAVTDPKFDEIIRDKKQVAGIICVSLGEVYQGYCYKLVATIF